MKEFSDNVNGFVRVASNEMIWFTLKSTDVLITSKISNVQNPNLAKILNVALSKDKAVILYNEQKLEYLKHTGDNQVTILFSRGFPAADLSLNGIKQYKMEIDCMCGGIEKLACYSSTLNCVIIRKAIFSCNRGTDTANTW